LGDKVDKEESVGVPHIYVEVNDKAELDDLYKHPRLPLVEDVLDGMGMGPKGPPIPPPAIFSVVPYPVHRKSPPGAEFSHYVFVTTNENDPYVNRILI
jgi:hydrocephalus-inducing protein